jgi:hypothetical protein
MNSTARTDFAAATSRISRLRVPVVAECRSLSRAARRKAAGHLTVVQTVAHSSGHSPDLPKQPEHRPSSASRERHPIRKPASVGLIILWLEVRILQGPPFLSTGTSFPAASTACTARRFPSLVACTYCIVLWCGSWSAASCSADLFFGFLNRTCRSNLHKNTRLRPSTKQAVRRYV